MPYYTTTSRERQLLEEIERLKTHQVQAEEDHKKVEGNLGKKIKEMKKKSLIEERHLEKKINEVDEPIADPEKLRLEIKEMDLDREEVERRVKGLEKESAKLWKQLNANMSLLSTQETMIDKLEAEISEMKGKEKRRGQVEYDDVQLSIANFVKEAGRGQSKEALIKWLVGQLLEMEKDKAEKDGEIRELREELAGLEEKSDKKDYVILRMKARMKETRDEWLEREAGIEQLITDHVWLMLRNLVDSAQAKLAYKLLCSRSLPDHENPGSIYFRKALNPLDDQWSSNSDRHAEAKRLFKDFPAVLRLLNSPGGHLVTDFTCELRKKGDAVAHRPLTLDDVEDGIQHLLDEGFPEIEGIHDLVAFLFSE